jgi:hypothetical protein
VPCGADYPRSLFCLRQRVALPQAGKPGGRFVCSALAGLDKWHILAGSADDAATQIRSTGPKAKAEGRLMKQSKKLLSKLTQVEKSVHNRGLRWMVSAADDESCSAGG